jgi:type II secretory pathway pseudopilin PulG
VINSLPGENGFALDVKAWDNEGRSAQLLFKPDDIRVAPALLLRPGRAVLEAGQNLKLTVLSRRRPETAFIDVIRDRQTVMTASMPLKDNRGELTLPLPVELAGVVKINAYLIDENGDRHGCSRFIFVNPANGLQVRARADKPVYRPGETARVELQVTNAKGESFPAALGICAVDESLLWRHSNSSGLVQSLLESENDLLTFQNHTRAFNSFDRLLANPLLAQAWLSTLQPPAGQPVLDELVTRDYLPQGLLERVRRWKGTPYYDRMRGDPAYQQVFQILEKQDGDYDLIEATGPAKKWAVEQHRARYFNAVKEVIGAGFACFCFASPLLLLVLAMKRGETRIIEVLVVIALLAILAGLMLPALAKAKAKAASVSARSDLKQVELAVAMAEADGLKSKAESTPRTAPTRVRRYFPETLFWRPEVITDEQGKAVIEIPLADSITTWRTSLDAINSHGQIGSTELPVRVFQDFFIDLDLPASLTLNDEISIPVTCYNYLDSPQEIRVTLNPAGWFESPQVNVQSTNLAPKRSEDTSFPGKGYARGPASDPHFGHRRKNFRRDQS